MARETFQQSGTINLANFTTTAYLPAKDAKIGSYNSFKESGKVMLQMGSANLSGAVSCALQVSVDKEYWAPALVETVAVTFSVSATTPVVEIIEGAPGLYWRIAVTINSKTGVIAYAIKDVE